ncbi:hypothetical protein U9M48_012437 [Paspalum notatum var. saurae]|uniref:Bifunctional inhibitor/plant lipid transfer protein/seed storage helical domain-containing protein n=1 Tax=Paspalum notatum var. saurae TaxID=547442 RepID=A0AAQ3WIE1_PASNO
MASSTATTTTTVAAAAAGGLLVVFLLLLAAAAPAAEAVCNMSNEQFMSCQPAAAKTTGPAADPTAACCDALRGADLTCLCRYKDSPWMGVYNIDPQRAMELPTKCGLAMPPNC